MHEITNKLVKCERCLTKDHTVNMRSVTIGNGTYMLCKECSKKYDQIRTLMAVKFQAFLREE